jgi:type IV secretory pathway VirB10-like protein
MNEPITEKNPKPPGLLPKNVQSWLLVSIALGMVLIMWITGGKKPPATPKAGVAVTPVPAPVEINETKIAELQSRIQELQREQLVAQSALAQQNRLLGAAPQDSTAAPQSYSGDNAPNERIEDPILAERKRRDYLSLFASNVAVTYRKNASSVSGPASSDSNPANINGSTHGPDAAQVAQALKDLMPLPALPQPPSPASLSQPSSAEAHTERKEEPRPAAASGGLTNAAAGKTYVLFEGTILETVLVNRLEGQFSGPLECLVTTDVYSHDRQHLLIPAGTRALGEAKKVENSGQTRLAVVFHRLIMPDGYSVSLDQFKGLDQIGDTGLRDQVNNHYLRIFGVSLAIGALGAVAEAGTGGITTTSGSDLMRQGFASSTAQSSAQILDRFLNILPTVTIREGHRVKVYLSGDLPLPDYNNHQMPSNL